MSGSHTILLIEDSEDDALLMKMALKGVAPTSQVHVAPDALDGMNYLSGVAAYADREKYPFPYLVICDLVLPGVSGLTFIEWVRRHEEWKHLLVLALTGAMHAADYGEVYNAGADTFLHKSPDNAETMEMLSGLFQFWIRHNIVPPDYAPHKRGKKKRNGDVLTDHSNSTQSPG